MLSPRFTSQFLDRHATESARLFVVALLWLGLFTPNFIHAQAELGQIDRTVNEIAADESTSKLINSPRRDELQRYHSSIKPLLMQACFDCHSGDSVEGNFRADQLDPDLVDGQDIGWWLEVYAALTKGEMPPPESNELTDTDRARIVEWLSAEIQTAEKLRNANANHSSFRRLTRYEYNYALQDLLGVPWTFSGDLPDEASEDDAFENNAASLHISVKQVETYQELAKNALRRVTVHGDQPAAVHWSISMEDAFRRERKRLDRKIESARKKFAGKPDEEKDHDKLDAEIAKVVARSQVAPGSSHFLELSTGKKAPVDWDYRKASYAFPHSDIAKLDIAKLDIAKLIPKPISYVAVVQPGDRQELTVELGDRLPDEGTMRVRIRASRAQGVEKRIPGLQLSFGFKATDQGAAIQRVDQQDVPIHASYGEPEIYQWDVLLGEMEFRNTYRNKKDLGEQPSPSEYIRFTNSTVKPDVADAESSAILIEHVEVTAPVYDQWPPRSHRAVFIDSENPNDETQYAKEIIANFMTRAWRRSASGRDVDRKLQLFELLRASSNDFQDAIVDVLATILTSPKFLYVLPGEPDGEQDQTSTQLSQNELATRLALFLWCSLPDKTLLELASVGHLNKPDVLMQQVERMLADPRSKRFSKHFVGQWLKMRPLEFLSPTRGDDGLDEALLESMKQEPIALFRDMLQRDSSVLDFIDSDYLVVNERLAKHYEIAAVQGNRFRRVSLADDRNRGGLLTLAGLLTMNSDGTDSHPVKRGVWLLTNLLNDPPPPPPPAVPEIDLSDPEIAKMTLKERIEDHRNHAACMSCHQKIDPWGIAFENYDAMGRRRDQINGKIVDAESMLPDMSVLDGMSGLKKYLVASRQEPFVRATVEKLASFALGRQLDFGDRAGITQITDRMRESGDGVATMVMCLVTSEIFQKQ